MRHMMSCNQTEKQSVLQHGFSVKNYLFDIINHLRDGYTLKYTWVFPEWVYQDKELILSSLPDDETLKLYTIFHDCGKPFCLEIDSDGKRHFPNHAQVSYEVFKKHFNNDIASELILHDMDIHTLKSDGIGEFSKNKYALTLLLTGLSELHSNSNMFGGVNSVSFKIKYKSLSKRGNQIINIKNK
jgi:hypothetical protein